MEKAMPKDAMVATDIGNVCSVSNSYLRFNQPGMLAAMTFGNCGYSFPAAMGAKVAAPHRPAIGYVGDGAWGMSLNEVLTCVREKIPTTAVVFHNKQWGAKKRIKSSGSVTDTWEVIWKTISVTLRLHALSQPRVSRAHTPIKSEMCLLRLSRIKAKGKRRCWS